MCMLCGLLLAYPPEGMRGTDFDVQLATRMRDPTRTAIQSRQVSMECIMFVRRIGTYCYEDLIFRVNPLPI